MPKRPTTNQETTESKRQCTDMDIENILETAAQMADIPAEFSTAAQTSDVTPEVQPFSLPIGRDHYVTLKEWKGTKRVDIRRWKDGKIPTYDGASLHLDEWKIICNITDLVDDMLPRAREKHMVDWRYHLGRDFALTIKSPIDSVCITKFCYPEHGRIHHMTCVGVSLDRDQWKELKKAMPLIEEREPELRHLIPLYRTDL